MYGYLRRTVAQTLWDSMLWPAAMSTEAFLHTSEKFVYITVERFSVAIHRRGIWRTSARQVKEDVVQE